MSQCVPNWEVEESTDTPRLPFYRGPDLHPTSVHLPRQPTRVECEVAELTWENGQLAMHGLGSREKPRQGGTLESIVRQAAGLPAAAVAKAGDELHPWFEHQRAAAGSLAMDALVPCSHQTLSVEELSTRVPGSGGPPVLSSARVGSCSASRDDGPVGRKRSRAAASIDVQSESQPTTAETAETAELSPDSPENTDDHDASSSRSRPQRGGGGRDDEKKKKCLGRCSTSTKRSRAAAIHNQSERKRRDRINQRMKTLQKLVPNSSKTDKASMLDEVIEYLKQLQAQIQMMSKLGSFPHMMMPMAMQQMQMAMMAQMGMGFGMGMGMGVMDMNVLARTGQPAGLPQVVHPSAAASSAAAFIPMTAPWEGFSDRLGMPGPPAALMPDPLSAFIAAQTQPMTLDAYTRLAPFYQHLHQQTGPPPSRT